MKSANLEKLKKLSDEISSKEIAEGEAKKDVVCGLQKVCKLLEKQRIDKKQIIDEINIIISKIC